MQFPEAKPLDVILNEIVGRVRQFTNADGAAIAIRDGDSVVTRATTGGIAPDLGARMSIQGSFTGLCLEKRTMLHCEDSDADARVDAKVCRQLSTRSFVVVPIEGTKEPQGVLAAFSSTPHAFSRTDIAVLKTASDQIRHALANISASDSRSPLPVGPAVARQKPEPQEESPLKARLAALLENPAAPVEKPAVLATTAPVALPVVPRPVVLKTPEQSAPSVATPARRDVQPASRAPKTHSAPALVSLAEAIETPAKAEPAPPQPLNEELPDGFREQYLGWKGFETHESSPRFSRKWLIGVAAVCVLLVGTVAVSMRRPLPLKHNAAAMDSSAVHAAEASFPEASQQAQTPAPMPVTPPITTLRPTERTEVTPSATKEKTVAVVKQPAMVVDSSAPRPGRPEVPDAEAPQISIASSTISALPDVKSAVPRTPKPPPMTLSDLEPSELIHKVVPQFPRFTNAAPGTQTVVLRARVLADGTIGDVQVVQGRKEFGESAKMAVKQWRYKPARMNGSPVETSVTVTLNFRR